MTRHRSYTNLFETLLTTDLRCRLCAFCTVSVKWLAEPGMLKIFLWLRYLRKKKIVFLSIAAVALSTALLIVVASLFTGFINALEQSAVEAIGDVSLAAPIRFTKHPLLIERLEETGAVSAATATLSVEGLLHLGPGKVRAVKVWGIEPGRRARVTGFKQFLRKQGQSDEEPTFQVPGFPDRVGGFVGIGVVAEPNDKTDQYDERVIEEILGEPVVLTTGTLIEARDSSVGGADDLQFKRRVRSFTVIDVVETGVYDLDKRFVYLPIEALQKTLYPNDDGQFANEIQIKLADDVRTDVALAEILGVWQTFAVNELAWAQYLIDQTTIRTAKDLQRRYIVELRKQMGVLLVIFGVVSFSVIVLIFCIFYMIVRLKQRDIAIIKSCGAASTSVAWVFVGFGACIGIVGSGIGTVLGYTITNNINAIEYRISIIFGLKLWKSSVYMFSRIPNQVDWLWALRIVLLATIAAAIGTLIPAIVASRTKPVEILRYE
jgi:lipoprotein-releasing system permease protein